MSTINEHRNEQIQITIIPTDQVDPNLWNPNELTAEQRAELLAEVRRLGRLPKPVVVRRKGDRYEIVDGEHGWRAAKECGLTEIPCEVVEIDDFTARLETYKRNQHGQHNRVREGQMFREMLKLRKISQRKLAAESGISEATLRNSLDYARAADLRNEHFQKHAGCSPRCTWIEQSDGIANCCEAYSKLPIDPERFSPAWGEVQVSAFSIQKLHTYLALPSELRDRWQDSGGRMDDLKDLDPNVNADELSAMEMLLKPVVELGLDELVSDGILAFRPSLIRAMALAQWGVDHPMISNVRAYLWELGNYRLDSVAEVLNNLPCEQVGQELRVLISVKEWASILADASARTDCRYELDQAIKLGIQNWLKEKGIAVEKVEWPVVAEIISHLVDAPAIIRDAEHWSLEEKLMLYTMIQQRPADMPEEVALQSIEKMCTDFRPRLTPGCRRSYSAGQSLGEVFGTYSRRLLKQRCLAAEEKAFADREQLLPAMISKMKEFQGNWNAKIGNRPAKEVLAERLKNLPDPEFQLIASLLCSCDRSCTAGRRWLAAAGCMTSTG
jgi:ParB/RepB/Spo0J family partition protein